MTENLKLEHLHYMKIDHTKWITYREGSLLTGRSHQTIRNRFKNLKSPKYKKYSKGQEYISSEILHKFFPYDINKIRVETHYIYQEIINDFLVNEIKEMSNKLQKTKELLMACFALSSIATTVAIVALIMMRYI